MPEKFDYSASFQYAIIKLMLEDEIFYLKCSKYFEFNPFESEITWFYYKILDNYYKEFKKLPGETVLRNETKIVDDKLREQHISILAKILSSDISDSEYLKKKTEEFIKYVIFKKYYNDIYDTHNNVSKEAAYKVVGEAHEVLNSITFSKDEYFTPSDIMDVLNNQPLDIKRKTPTGIQELDERLLGGPGAGEVFTVLAEDGVGKSMFLMNVGAIALMKGKKVLHFHCEGKITDPILRYCSRITQIPLADILANRLDSEQLKKVEHFQKNYADKLIVKPFLGLDRTFGGKFIDNTIQGLIGYCSIIRKTFDFDVLIVDYGDKLGTDRKVESQRFVWLDVWQGFEALAKEFDIPVFTASQAVRGQRKKGTRKLGKDEYAESKYKSRLSTFSMSINRSNTDVQNGKVVFYIDKVRNGKGNLTVICDCDYSKCTTHFVDTDQISSYESEDDYESEEPNPNV